MMHRSSMGMLAIATVFAATSAFAQGSATPTEGRSATTPRAPASSGAAPQPAQPAGVGHLPNGNPNSPPSSTTTHEPPSK
jgi:hypothetical protein